MKQEEKEDRWSDKKKKKSEFRVCFGQVKLNGKQAKRKRMMWKGTFHIVYCLIIQMVDDSDEMDVLYYI